MLNRIKDNGLHWRFKYGVVFCLLIIIGSSIISSILATYYHLNDSNSVLYVMSISIPLLIIGYSIIYFKSTAKSDAQKVEYRSNSLDTLSGVAVDEKKRINDIVTTLSENKKELVNQYIRERELQLILSTTIHIVIVSIMSMIANIIVTGIAIKLIFPIILALLCAILYLLYFKANSIIAMINESIDNIRVLLSNSFSINTLITKYLIKGIDKL